MDLIWHSRPTTEELNELTKDSLSNYLGIEFLEVGDNFLTARMPVAKKTSQPKGMLHGGASATLAETMGSIAANYCVDQKKYFCVGLELNINHIRSVPIDSGGFVTAITKPFHLGKTTQVWDIQLYNEKNNRIAISRLTIAILSIKKGSPNGEPLQK